MNKLYLHKNKMRQGQLPLMGLVFFLLFFLLPRGGNLRMKLYWMFLV